MSIASRQILAISNSSALFVEAWEPTLLAQHLVKLSGKASPVICYIGAANGDSPEKVSRFYALARRVGFEPRHLNLFAMEDGNSERFFNGVDIIYIDGGSTRNLRALLEEWGADTAIEQAYQNGTVICGASAGANIMFEWGMTDSIKTRIEPTMGLGVLPGTLSVHSNVREDRALALADHMRSAVAAYPVFALDDGVALHFVDGALHSAVSVRPNARLVCDMGAGKVDHPMMLLSEPSPMAVTM